MTTAPSSPAPGPDLPALFDGLQQLVAVGACDAALRVAKDLFPAQHPMEQARRLRQRAVLLIAQCADLRADKQAARVAGKDLERAEASMAERARDFLNETRTFAKDDRVGARDAGRAYIVFEQAKAAANAAAGRARARGVSIFVSYRRDDSGEMTGFIAERLQRRFGEDDIFMDVDSIPFGVNYRAYIVSTLAKCKVCLVVIGPQWIEVKNKDGKRRIEDDNDLVRIEVETALKIGVPVVPLLVREAKVPTPDQLPPALAEFHLRNGHNVRAHPDFENDMERLISRLEEQLG